MSRVLVVVEICAIIFVLVGLSSSPALLLGFGLNLWSGDLSASKEQPQHFILPLGSVVVRYLSLKVHFSTCSKKSRRCWNSRLFVSELPAQTVGTFDCY